MKSKFKNVDEFYSAIDLLVRMLEEEGRESIASEINELVNETAWTTGAELLGDLSLYLNNVSSPLSIETKSHLSDCRYFCNNYRRIMRIQH